MYIFSVSIIAGRKTSTFLHFISFRRMLNKYVLESIIQKITNFCLNVKKLYSLFASEGNKAYINSHCFI